MTNTRFSPKAAALNIRPGLVSRTVWIDSAYSLGKVRAYQVFDGDQPAGQRARSALNAWWNAYFTVKPA